ncbi:putative house-cleaning noncanonical NTP pyrophosphatase (MazG superfamily) [Paenibacillus sp. DS2015]|uniref:DNA-binding protein n=1 Tax=Paenibacillus sp. DS2015 TaxID=3373917 RepID=UPI003D20F61A
MMELDLNDILNLDSLTEMLKGAFALDAHEQMIQIADQLYTCAYSVYEERQLQRAKGERLATYLFKHNIIYYLGFSLMAKGIALQKLFKLGESRNCIEKYSKLGWVNELDKEGQEEVDYYKTTARANTYTLDLLEGKEEVLEEYVNFISESEEEELLPGIITILESAIMHNFNVDHILTKFGEKIERRGDYYETKENIRYYVDYLYLLSIYRFKENKHEIAINVILKVLVTSDKLRDDTGFKKICVLFESFRTYASQEQLEEYTSISKKILKGDLKNEKSIKGIVFDGDRIFTS